MRTSPRVPRISEAPHASTRRLTVPVRRDPPRPRDWIRRRLLAVVLAVLIGIGIGCTGPAEASSDSAVQAAGQAPGDPSDESPDPSQDPSPAPSEGSTSQDRSGISAASLWWLWALVGLIAGYIVGRTTKHRRSATTTSKMASTADPPDPPGTGDPPRVSFRDLVEDLVLAHDLARDEATAGHLEQVLARHGVVRVPAEPGTAFDSTRHRAVGTEPMGSPPDDPVIVRVVRPGWRTQTDLVRQPEVIVTPPPTSPPR